MNTIHSAALVAARDLGDKLDTWIRVIGVVWNLLSHEGSCVYDVWAGQCQSGHLATCSTRPNPNSGARSSKIFAFFGAFASSHR